jgi:tRNA A-37 threonylcarbamoyl transferase component Bud32
MEEVIPCLFYEEEIYDQLKSLQGQCVPVYLGSIDLVREYNIAVNVNIVHMLLLSWGGESIDKEQWWDDTELNSQMGRICKKMRSLGIIQGDLASRNILKDSRSGGIMVIDFERATRIESSKTIGTKVATILQEMSPNQQRKRKKRFEEEKDHKRPKYKY